MGIKDTHIKIRNKVDRIFELKDIFSKGHYQPSLGEEYDKLHKEVAALLNNLYNP